MTEYIKKIYIKTLELCNKPYLKVTGAAVGVVALVWWCVFYPELCFPRDTYEAVYETHENGVLENADIILEADDDQIVISSRLFEWLSRK